MLTTVLAVAGIWSSDPGFTDLWRIPAGLLLVGLVIEGLFLRRAWLTAEVETASRAFLGREQVAAFAFHNSSTRPMAVEYAPVTPAGIEPISDRTRKIVAPAGAVLRDPFTLLAVRMGPQRWPVVPARVLGPLGLAWWSRDLSPSVQIAVAPDALVTARVIARGNPAGARPRRVSGAGSELHQLREYVQGDSLARMDWKATARTRRLVTREFSEDQHLDVLVAIDAGRLSKVRAGRLDRFGVYANVVARFAQIVVPNDDRIGMIVYADRPLAVCPPDRGLPAVTRIRTVLGQLSVQSSESDPLAAAVRIRSLLHHRGLVVLLTDLDDASVADQLARAVRLLSPPHLVVVAGIRSPEIHDLARREAHSWLDPWVSLAAEEHEARSESRRMRLRKLGAPVIATTEGCLERAVFAEYESLRRSRRI